MTLKNHTTGETAEPTPTPQHPPAIPPDYVPQPYPGWRWNDATGESKVVNSLAEEEAARAEGFTSREPPTGEAAPKTPPTPTPKDPDLPPYRRPRLHDGD